MAMLKVLCVWPRKTEQLDMPLDVAPVVLGRDSLGLQKHPDAAQVSREHCQAQATIEDHQVLVEVKALRKGCQVVRAGAGSSVEELPKGQATQLHPGDKIILAVNPDTGHASVWAIVVTKEPCTQSPARSLPVPASKTPPTPTPSHISPAVPDSGGLMFGRCRFLVQRVLPQLGHDTRVKKIKAFGGVIEDRLTPNTTHVIVSQDISHAALVKLLQGAQPQAGPSTSTHLPEGPSQQQEAEAQQELLVQLQKGPKLLHIDFITQCLEQGQLVREGPYVVQIPQEPVQRKRSPPVQSCAPAPAASLFTGQTFPPLPPASMPTPAATSSPVDLTTLPKTSLSLPAPVPSISTSHTTPRKRPLARAQTTPARVQPAVDVARSMPIYPWHQDPSLAPLDAPWSAQPAQHGPEAGQEVQPEVQIQVCSDPRVDWGVHGRWCEPYDEQKARNTLVRLRRHWLRQDLKDGRSGGGTGGGRGSGRRRNRRSSRSSSSDEEMVEAADDAQVDTAADERLAGVNTVCNHIACLARPFCIIAELQLVADAHEGKRGTTQFRHRAAQGAITLLKDSQFPVTCRADLDALHITGVETLKKCEEIIGTGRLLRNQIQHEDVRFQAIKALLKVWGVGESAAQLWYKAGLTSVEVARQVLFRTLGQAGGGDDDDDDCCTSSAYDTEEERQGRGRAGDRHKRVKSAAAVCSPGRAAPSASGPTLAAPVTFTEQQRVGLTYYYDFLERVPRAEIARIESVVHQAVVDVLCDITGLSADVVNDPCAALHCRAMGSYSRGAPSSADIDFVISPPAACEDLQAVQAAGGKCAVESPYQLMCHLLDKLLEMSVITCDCAPDSFKERHAKAGPLDHMTFLGVWAKGGPAQSALYRRIDFKVYRRANLATGVTYFGSGTFFNRALRYWANHPPPEVKAAASAAIPGLMAWQLSDTELVPELTAANLPQRAAGVLSPAPSTPGGSGLMQPCVTRAPSVHPVCETDLFEALHLDYVPLHMRSLM